MENNTIKKLLEEQRLTQRALAKLIDIEPYMVSKWVAGVFIPGTKPIIKMCKLFPNYIPHDFAPHVFPNNLRFKFLKQKE